MLDSGDYPPGSRLPPVRALAQRFKVNNLTALQAYRWLEQQQRVVARARSGFFAAACASSHGVESERQAAPITWVHIDDRVSSLLSLSSAALDVPLHMAEADAGYYPSAELARRLQHKLQRDPSLLGAHLPVAEQQLLRGELIRLAAERQMQLPQQQILMTHGCTEAIQLALRCLTRPGDVVAVESPVYFGLLQTLESLGLKALEIPCSAQYGLSLEALEFALRYGPAIACLVVVPHFQNPTGALMPDENKKQLLELARQYNLPMIEDDVFGDLHHSGERPIPIKAWDHDGRVIYCASFTKSFAPAFRLGWTSGGKIHERMERLKISNSYVSSALIQATMADCLASGLYARQVAHMRQQLAQQCRRLTEAVLAAFPRGTTVSQAQGGMLLWIKCPAGLDSIRLLQQALPHSLSFAPGPVFSAEPRFENCLRLSAGHPWTPRLQQAIQTLGRLVHEQLTDLLVSSKQFGPNA